MSHYDTFSVHAAEAPIFRRWMPLAFAGSIALHVGLFFYLQTAEIGGVALSEEQSLPSRPVKLIDVKIPEQRNDPTPPPPVPEKVSPNLNPLMLPADKPVAETDVHLAPQNPDFSKIAFQDKPKIDTSAADRMAKSDANARAALDKQLSTNLGDLLPDRPKVSARQATLSIGKRKGGAGEGTEGVPGLNSLDDLLAQTGSFSSGQKAAMSGGALFEYDSADLLAEGIESLRKLGTLIQQNPNFTFSIEGHTDSFGGPEYNLQLSLRRAETVKWWLVENMGIPEHRIQTRGLGSMNLLVPAERSRDEQAPNRRVEIVLKRNPAPRRR